MLMDSILCACIYAHVAILWVLVTEYTLACIATVGALT